MCTELSDIQGKFSEGERSVRAYSQLFSPDLRCHAGEMSMYDGCLGCNCAYCHEKRLQQSVRVLVLVVLYLRSSKQCCPKKHGPFRTLCVAQR